MASTTTMNPSHFLCRKWAICIFKMFANCAEDNRLDGALKVAVYQAGCRKNMADDQMEKANAEMQEG